jgi:hypothetical protein
MSAPPPHAPDVLPRLRGLGARTRPQVSVLFTAHGVKSAAVTFVRRRVSVHEFMSQTVTISPTSPHDTTECWSAAHWA